MRIALVFSHPAPVAKERTISHGGMRELVFAAELRRLGVDIEVFRIAGRVEVPSEQYLDGQVTARFFASDDPSVAINKHVSSGLIKHLRAWRPDLILFKGFGYDVSEVVMRKLGDASQYGMIAGGMIKDRDVRRYAMVLPEYLEQLRGPCEVFLDDDRYLVMPKYIDFSLCPAVRPGYGQRPVDIVNVGDFQPRKNQKALLPLADDLSISFVGDGETLAETKALFSGKPLTRFRGRLGRENVFKTLAGAKVMVHPSVREGLPRAVVEAMSCGLPVVAYLETIFGGLVDGEQGYLVRKDELEAKTRAIIADEALWEQMSARNWTHARNAHGPEAVKRAAQVFYLKFVR